MKFAFTYKFGPSAQEANSVLHLSWDAWKATLHSPWSAL